MQPVIQNTINIALAFNCKLCKKVALEPLQNQCCTIIVCQTCTGPTCHHCKKPCAYLKSPFLQHLYKCIAIKCPYKCKAELTLYMLKNHMAGCPQATMECLFCKDKNIKIAAFPEHMGSKHEEECTRLLIEFHKVKNVPKVEEKLMMETKISPFRTGVVGVPRICVYGRLTCGQPLPGLSNRDLFNSSNIAYCTPLSGSCGKCMALDRERLGLQKNCLLNNEGRICHYDAAKKSIGCGIRSIRSLFDNRKVACNYDKPCRPCQSTLEIINAGLYRDFLGP